MRQLGVTVAAVCAAGLLVAPVGGQTGGLGPGTPAMPGQVVGTPLKLNPVGTTVPKAAPPVGQRVGNPLNREYNPAKPLDVFKGTGLDPNSVVAPIQGFPGVPTQNPNLLERVAMKIGTMTGFYKPSAPTRSTYVPSMSRRNRERAMERMWRRD